MCLSKSQEQEHHACEFRDEGQRTTDKPHGGQYAVYVRNYELHVEERAYVEELAGIEDMWDSRVELGRTSSEEQTKSRKNTGGAHVARQTVPPSRVAQKGMRDGEHK